MSEKAVRLWAVALGVMSFFSCEAQQVTADQKPPPCSFATEDTWQAASQPVPACNGSGCLVCVPRDKRAQCYWIDNPRATCPR